MENHAELTDMLIEAGADVNAYIYMRPKSTPLLEAIYARSPDVSERLIKAGARLDWMCYADRGSWRVSVLPAAISWGHLPLIRNLIAAGVDVNAPGLAGLPCALTSAVHSRDMHLVRLLINAGANPNTSEQGDKKTTALEIAIRQKDLDIVTYLLEQGADPCERCLIAAVRGDMSILPILYDAKLRIYPRCPQGFGARALQFAIACCQEFAIEFLISKNVDLNYVVRYPYPDEWSEKFQSIRGSEESAFRTAIKHNCSCKIIKQMLKNNANPNGFHNQERDSTPLLTAIEKKSLSLVRILVKAGAEVNPSTWASCRRTPLQAAVEVGSMRITKELLRHGAHVNAPLCNGTGGATAMQLAAIKGYIGIASLLLELGADVNAPAAKKYGRTALEGAAENGRIDMVQFLVNAGALLQGSGDAQYQKARAYALKEGHRATWRLLETCRLQQQANPPLDLSVRSNRSCDLGNGGTPQSSPHG